MIAELGIMQGRLSPPVNKKVQAFPSGMWQEEFDWCAKLGLGCMEWIYEYPSALENPLETERGISEIRAFQSRHGVRVGSVVADYFMVKRLFSEKESELRRNCSVLERIVSRCAAAGIPILELPFVDSSALVTDSDMKEIVVNLRPALELAKRKNVKISLETSLPPERFLHLIEDFKPLEVFVNYDMGNSASLGYDAKEEIRTLGEFIINVHIKDRVLGGGTVPLGKGDTDFETVFRELKAVHYQGDYILQAAREDLGSGYQGTHFVETVKKYIEFVTPFIGI